MAFRQKRHSYALAVEGAAITEIGSGQGGSIQLRFDDQFNSRLVLDGSFMLHCDEREDVYGMADRPWVDDVLASLLQVRIEKARFNRRGRLELVFADGRALSLPYDFGETWHYTNDQMQGWWHD